MTAPKMPLDAPDATTEPSAASLETTKAVAAAKLARAGESFERIKATVIRFLERIDFIDRVKVDQVANEQAALRAYQKLVKRVTIQAMAVGVAAGALFVLLPFFQDPYIYYAVTPEKNTKVLRPLNMPLYIDSTIKTWAANSVTEILTVGFGDFERKLLQQKHRFTPLGWADFVQRFFEKQVGAVLRGSQLVLTTVPDNDAEIISQGASVAHVYQWQVKVPVIMTYATNNFVTKAIRTSVTLTIVRVPYDSTDLNNNGIAIDVWQQ